jgi:hypothetical protein
MLLRRFACTSRLLPMRKPLPKPLPQLRKLQRKPPQEQLACVRQVCRRPRLCLPRHLRLPPLLLLRLPSHPQRPHLPSQFIQLRHRRSPRARRQLCRLRQWCLGLLCRLRRQPPNLHHQFRMHLKCRPGLRRFKDLRQAQFCARPRPSQERRHPRHRDRAVLRRQGPYGACRCVRNPADSVPACLAPVRHKVFVPAAAPLLIQ